MRTIFNSLFFVIFLFVSTSAWSAGAWTGHQSVQSIQLRTENIFIRLADSSAQINPGGCASNYYFVLDSSINLFKEQYQAVLTALAAGKKVSFYIDGCIGTYPKAKHAIVIG